MAKRGPQSDLTDRNWDQEDEPEEAGVFKQASTDIIQQRMMKRAKRRLPDEDTDVEKKKAFGGFGGLVTPRPNLKTSGDKKSTPISFGGFTSDVNSSTFKAGIFSGASSLVDHEETSKTDSKYPNFLQTLKALNESVLTWVKQHVEKNPYIILTPVFQDYEKHLATLEDKKDRSQSGPIKSMSPPDSSNSNSSDSKPAPNLFPSKVTLGSTLKSDDKAETTEPSKPSFSFGSNSSPSNGTSFKLSSTNSNTLSSGFSFGTKTAASPATGGFSFAQSTINGTSNAPGGFSSSSTSGFSFGTTSSLGGSGTSGFGSLAGATASSTKKTEDDDDYVPPKPEVKEIKEQNAVYTKRCKLFYKKDDQWADRGVGNLHLKAVNENKTQIVIRADTNLGNILLNIMLVESLPMSRSGKNNVLLVCAPNPPIKEGDTDPNPVPMLIRVKTETDADELLSKLEDRKKLLS